MSILDEFKKFIMRGSVVDLAIGVIIGAAFGKIVSSLVNDIVMPPIGLLIGEVDFSDLAFTLKKASSGSPAVAIKYGLFLNTVIDFLIIAAAIFAVVKIMNRLQSTEAPPQVTKECPECLMQIPVLAKRCSYCTSYLEKR